jgi:MYXO-CTERM domain-containing protein
MAGDPAEIEQRIRATRAELSTTIDELVDRVSPGQVKARSRAALNLKAKEVAATVSRVGRGGGGPPPPALAAAATLLLGVLLMVRRRRRRSR